MAVECPCDCGRSVKRSTKRSAERAVYLASLAQVPARLAVVYATTAPSSVTRMTRLCREGQSLSAQMLAVVHGGSHKHGAPTTAEMRSWETEALRLIPVVQQADPRWCAAWPGLVVNRCGGRGRSQAEQPKAPSIGGTMPIEVELEAPGSPNREAQARLFAEIRKQRNRQ